MKKLATILLLLISLNIGHAQEDDFSIRAIGIDVSTPLILLAGGNKASLDFEFLYRISRPKTVLRFKSTIGKQNFFNGDLVKATEIEYSSPQNLKYFESEYLPIGNFIGSFGLSKKLKNQRIPLYVALDANIGIARAEIQSTIRTVVQGMEHIEQLSSQKNTLLIMGITPVLGLQKQLTEKISFAIEFGLPLNVVQGQINYNNESGIEETEPVYHLDSGEFKIINDLVFFINI